MSKKKIAVIGAGTAGLHLGLYLRTHGVDVTIYTDRRPNEYRDIRLLNTVAHHHVTISREDMLECNHWPSDRDGYFGHYYYVGGPQPMRFYGKLGKPSRAVDYRIYHPQLMQDFVDRGGVIEYREITHDDVPEITSKHDLLVVCTGKGPFGRMFARDESESPFDRPQRALCVGLFKGIKENPIRAVTMNFSPGAGEMIEIPTISFNGMCTALVLENHIGGDLEVLTNTKYDDDREAFLKLMLEKLRVHYPDCYARIDQAEFDLANGPLDILQGGVTPTVRTTHIVLDDGKVAVALGDVHAVVDPVLGQGANMASHAAVILAEEIVRQDIFDARFIEKVNARRNDRVLSGMRWTNYILDSLRTLSPDILQFIVSIAQNPDLADEFTENFNYPELQWDCFASSRRTQDWVTTRVEGNANSVECEKELAVAS
jgi:styrene monooxygenase